MRTLARARTLTVLVSLDSEHNRDILQFLREAQLISGRDPIISLNRANLSGANLSGVDLRGVDLSGADLRKADLSSADLSDADLSAAKLKSADLSFAITCSVPLRFSTLCGLLRSSSALLRRAAVLPILPAALFIFEPLFKRRPVGHLIAFESLSVGHGGAFE